MRCLVIRSLYSLVQATRWLSNSRLFNSGFGFPVVLYVMLAIIGWGSTGSLWRGMVYPLVMLLFGVLLLGVMLVVIALISSLVTKATGWIDREYMACKR